MVLSKISWNRCSMKRVGRNTLTRVRFSLPDLNTTWIAMPNKGPSRLVLLSCRGFPKKASRTARIASDEEIQGTKDAVIQDLERKLRFKEDLLSNGQPVRYGESGPGLRTRERFPASLRLRLLTFVHKPDGTAFGSPRSS